MPVQLGTTGQPDFTQPIELMMDCHRRIEHFLGVLQKVAERYHQIPLDDQARQALTTALNYFAGAAPMHTADEEHSLFPRMRESGDPQVQQAMAEIDRLESDHRDAETAHARLDALGRQWLTDGRLPDEPLAEFRALLAKLAKTYQEHIPIEDNNVFMLAKRILDDDQLRDVGREMKHRRIEAASRPESPGHPNHPLSRCAERRRQLKPEL